MKDELDALIAEWEAEVAEFATKDDPYYNGVRQCIDDLKAVLANELERCGARGPSKWLLCALPPGHEGNHKTALDKIGWPQ